MIVVVIQAAFSHGNRTAEQMLADRRDIAPGVERRCIVGVNTGRERDEPSVLGGDGGSALGGPKRFTDAHNAQETGGPGAGNDVGAIRIECGIGQMCVAVDQSVPRSRGAVPNRQDPGRHPVNDYRVTAPSAPRAGARGSRAGVAEPSARDPTESFPPA